MNDQMKEIFVKLSRRLDLVVTGILLFLLALTGWLAYQETNYIPPEATQGQPRNFSEKLPVARVIPPRPDQKPENLAQYEEVAPFVFDPTTDITKDEEAYALVERNMFDIKTVEEAERKAEELNQQYNQAVRLFQDAKFQEALQQVNQILAEDPRHRAARDLKNRLEETLAPAPTAAPESGTQQAVPPPGIEG
jgi:hypothetical protein